MENKQLVYGIGVNDLKSSVKSSSDKEYKLWRDMLKRCYHKQYLSIFPTYQDVDVCEDWLTYSNFKKDLHEIHNFDMLAQGWTLDKDILTKKKLYSKNTCCIVPQQLNIFFSKFSLDHNPPFDKRCNVYYSYCSHNKKKHYLGRFKTKGEACSVYLAFKATVVEDLINIYKGIVDDRVIDKLYACKEALNEQVRVL